VKKELYEAQYEEDEVFAKDFPAYIYRQKLYDPAELIPDGYVHIFLLRPPKACVTSAYKIFQRKQIPNWTTWDSATNEMAGFKALWEMYNLVKKFQPDPLVIHADDVMDSPEATLRLLCERTGLKFEESMMHWSENDGLKEKMDATLPALTLFTETVMNTSGFQQPTGASKTEVELPPEIQQCVEEHNVYYEKLMQFVTRVAPASQP